MSLKLFNDIDQKTIEPKQFFQTQSQLTEINSNMNYKLGFELLKFEESLGRLKVAYDEFNDDQDPIKNKRGNDRRISSSEFKNGRSKMKKKVEKEDNAFFENMLLNHDSVFKRSHD